VNFASAFGKGGGFFSVEVAVEFGTESIGGDDGNMG
jgi:hypothetical protein